MPNIQGPALVPSTSQTRCRLEGGCGRSGTQGFPWLHSHFGENMEDMRPCLPHPQKREFIESSLDLRGLSGTTSAKLCRVVQSDAVVVYHFLRRRGPRKRFKGGRNYFGEWFWKFRSIAPVPCCSSRGGA